MPTKTVHIIILGSSLGARLAAVLLARQGQSVVHFCPTGDAGESLESAPPLLIRFLDLLDARTCLRPTQATAILTPASRIELHGSVNLKDELHRELGSAATDLIRHLDKLEETSNKLTDYFWDNEGVPLTLAQRTLLPALLLRHGLSSKRLKRTASDSTRLLSAEANSLLHCCFSAHCQASLDRLTFVETALTWAELNSPQEVAVSALNDLLANRFKSAGGDYRRFSPDATLEILPGKQAAVNIDGSQLQANHVLLGAGLPSNPTHLASLSGGYTTSYSARFLTGSPAEIFPDRIATTLHGNPPLQIRLTGSKSSRTAEIKLPYQATPADSDTLLERLESLFAFSRLRMTDGRPGCQLPKPVGFPGRYQSFQLSGRHYWNISGASVFPTLLNTGECLAAMTLAAHLSR